MERKRSRGRGRITTRRAKSAQSIQPKTATSINFGELVKAMQAQQSLQINQPLIVQPVQPVQQQPQSISDIFFEQTRVAIEKLWEKGSPHSYAAFKLGEALASSPHLPVWLRNAGGVLLLGGVFVGLDDADKAINRKRSSFR